MINDIRLLLLAEPTIVALVNSRVYVDVAPLSSMSPRILLYQMGSDEENDLENSGDARTVEFDVDCEGDTAEAAYGLSQVVRMFLKDFDGTAGAITIDACVIDDEHTKKAQRTTNPVALRQFVVTLELQVFYRP